MDQTLRCGGAILERSGDKSSVPPGVDGGIWESILERCGDVFSVPPGVVVGFGSQSWNAVVTYVAYLQGWWWELVASQSWLW